MNSASVSILIPSKNRNDYLARALDSIVLQNYPGLRIYIVDNNNDEKLSIGIKNLIAAFQKKNTSLDWTYLHSTKKNSAGVKNDGIALIETKYLCFLDDDDELCANSIHKRVEEMHADDELALLYCGGYSKTYGYPFKMYRYYHHSQNADHQELKMMSCSSMIINVEIFRNADIKFEEALDRLEDYDLGKQLISKGLKIKSIPDPLVIINQHPYERMSTYNPDSMEFKNVLIKKWAGATHEYVYRYIAGLFLWRRCFGIEKKPYRDIVAILKNDFNRKPSVVFKCQYLLASFSPLIYLSVYHFLLVFWQLRYNSGQRNIKGIGDKQL